MLNKIRFVGKVIIARKEGLRKETEGEGIKSSTFFSVLVINPTNALTPLRCVARGQIMNNLSSLENDDLVAIKGYIRNEKEGNGILTNVTEITKLEQGTKPENHLRLIGKIISDLELIDDPQPKLRFRLVVPREERQLEDSKRTDHSAVFYCKVQDNLVAEFHKQLKKGDIILLEGFLQTKKTVDQAKNKVEWPSHVIVQGFTLLDADTTLIHYPIDKLNRVFREAEKIDFSKEKSTTT